MRTAQGREFLGELIEDNLPVGFASGIQRLHTRLQRLQIVDGGARSGLTGFRKLRLDLFEVLLDLLLIRLDRIDVRPQLAEALVEDGYLLADGLVLGWRSGSTRGTQNDPYGKNEKLLVFHGGSLEIAWERCKSRIHMGGTAWPGGS